MKERGTDGGHILLLPVTCAWTRFGICRERILHAKCQDSSTGQIGSQFFFFFFFFLGGGGGSLLFFSLSFFSAWGVNKSINRTGMQVSFLRAWFFFLFVSPGGKKCKRRSKMQQLRFLAHVGAVNSSTLW